MSGCTRLLAILLLQRTVLLDMIPQWLTIQKRWIIAQVAILSDLATL